MHTDQQIQAVGKKPERAKENFILHREQRRGIRKWHRRASKEGAKRETQRASERASDNDDEGDG